MHVCTSSAIDSVCHIDSCFVREARKKRSGRVIKTAQAAAFKTLKTMKIGRTGLYTRRLPTSKIGRWTLLSFLPPHQIMVALSLLAIVDEPVLLRDASRTVPSARRETCHQGTASKILLARMILIFLQPGSHANVPQPPFFIISAKSGMLLGHSTVTF
jgi:hypothetical protein